MNTIDTWAQILTPKMAAAPWMESLLRWIGKDGESVTPTVDQTIESMNDAGVDIALLSAWYGPEGELIGNEQVFEQVAEAPERFRGIASVDIRKPAKAVRELRHWLEKKAFVGVRVLPWLWNLPPNDKLFYPVYTACVDEGVPFCTQIGHTGPLRRSEPGRLIPYLEDVLLDFPDLRVVGGHVGYPWIDELTSLTFKFENLFVDTSAYALARLPASFVQYMKGPGRRRVMFGTNWPMIGHGKCLEGLNKLGLNDNDRDAFLGATARRVFGL